MDVLANSTIVNHLYQHKLPIDNAKRLVGGGGHWPVARALGVQNIITGGQRQAKITIGAGCRLCHHLPDQVQDSQGGLVRRIGTGVVGSFHRASRAHRHRSINARPGPRMRNGGDLRLFLWNGRSHRRSRL